MAHAMSPITIMGLPPNNFSRKMTSKAQAFSQYLENPQNPRNEITNKKIIVTSLYMTPPPPFLKHCIAEPYKKGVKNL